jgi:hypothetical protein
MSQDLVAVIATTALGLSLLGLLVALIVLLRVSRAGRRGGRGAAVGDASLEATVTAQLERLSALDTRVTALDVRAKGAVQRIGVVRFNPFEDTGSNQSFALALLDARGNGVVISSLHSRQATRVYLKQISGGEARPHCPTRSRRLYARPERTAPELIRWPCHATWHGDRRWWGHGTPARRPAISVGRTVRWRAGLAAGDQRTPARAQP